MVLFLGSTTASLRFLQHVFNSTCKKALGTALQLEGKETLTNTSKLARANATGKKTTLVIFMCNNDIH